MSLAYLGRRMVLWAKKTMLRSPKQIMSISHSKVMEMLLSKQGPRMN